MKIKSFPMFAAAFAVFLPLLMTIPARAGTITVVPLPGTNTDLASGITTNKTYVSAFDFGNRNTTTYSVNSVPFAHVATKANNVYALTNWADANHAGDEVFVSVSTNSSANNEGVDVTSSTPPGTQADGNMLNLLYDQIYPGNGQPAKGYLQEVYSNLIPNDQYSLRIYYRAQTLANSNRLMDVWFDGEGTNQPYAGNPLSLDTNVVLHSSGANYIEYDFTASGTTVTMLMTNVNGGQGGTTFAATLENDSIPYAPFITRQASVAPQVNGSYLYSVQAIGTPSLSFQWYSNSVASYTGAAMVTDSSDFSGSGTSNLTTTATTTTNELLNYYFVVAANAEGYATSSIVQINPAATVVMQPTSANVANSYVQFSMVAAGFQPVAYQWYFNTASNYTGATALTDGNGVSGSATNILTTTTNLADYYFVVVSNSFGSATSSIAAYNPLPFIVTQPAVAKVGNAVQVGVTANGWPTLGYQWYFNNTATYSGASPMTDGNGVSGSATPTVTITNVLDYYFAIVTNYYGSATSAVVAAAIPLTVTAAGEPIWNTASETNIIVTFSDLVNPTTATTLANYSLNNSASVSSVTLVASNEVALTTTPLTGSYTLTVQNVKDLNFGILMTPSSTNIPVGVYPANVALWLKASAANVTIDSSGNVSQWNDLTANQNDFYGPGVQQPAGSPNDPVFTTNVWGDPVVRFAGTNLSELGAVDASSLEITGDMSVVAVINFATLAGGTNGEIISKTGATSKNIPAPYDYYVGGAGVLYRGNGTNYGDVAASSGPTTNAPHILAVSESGNTVSQFLDGVAVGSANLNNNFQEMNCFDQGQPIYLGARADFHNCLAGDLSELIVSAAPITAYDVSELTPYLAKEHNISLVNTSPTNILFSVSGGNITLSWPADHTGWTLQAQTNSVSAGLSNNWVTIPASTTVDQMTFPVNPANGTVFYRLMYNP